MTTNAESFKTGLLNSEKHSITSKQSSSFSDSGLPVDYQFSTAPVQDFQSSYGEVDETATNSGLLCQQNTLKNKSHLQKVQTLIQTNNQILSNNFPVSDEEEQQYKGFSSNEETDEESNEEEPDKENKPWEPKKQFFNI